MENYLNFLQQKQKTIQNIGFFPIALNENLFDFQKYCVEKALQKGKFAIFAGCGLGKTIIQLEWAKQVVEYTNKPVLIISPLAVSSQTIQEGQKFGIKVNKYSGQIELGIYITNYEQLDNIDASIFGGVVLDESSIIKNFKGKIRNKIMIMFDNTFFKLACTATPSPNDSIELGNHAEFLNIMSRNEMLAMYFIHDGGKTSDWKLKGHAKEAFYDFVAQWSLMFSKPSNIGFLTKGYELPPLNLVEKQIKTKIREGSAGFFNEVAISATNFNSELRLTKLDRLQEVVKIVNNSDENFIIWIKQNEEGDYLRKEIKGSIEVKGNDSIDWKESKLLGFANNEFKILITKPKIAQYGLNWQNCNNQIFASLDYSFESLFQAIHRSYRFGQLNIVNIYIITTDTMQNVIDTIKKKQKQFTEMQEFMIKATSKSLNINKKENKYNKLIKMELPKWLN